MEKYFYRSSHRIVPLNSVKQTRRLTLQIDHPGIIWTVIAFSANVLEWELPQKPPRGNQRHHVKASGVEFTVWSDTDEVIAYSKLDLWA